MKRATLIANLIFLIIILPAISGCGGHGQTAGTTEKSDEARGSAASEGAEPATSARVRVRAIEERRFEDAVTSPGQWRSAGQIVVSAPFAGIVESLAVRPGDRVRQGQVLCRLLTRESRAALRGAEIMLRQAHDDATREEAARALALARRELVRVEVSSPHEGSVIDVSAQPGSEIVESVEILTIQAPDAVVFEARIDPSEAPRIRAGQRALIVEQGRTESRAAIVQRILPVAGMGDQATLAWLAPEMGAGSSPPTIDRFGTATITTGVPRNAPGVPDSAIVHDDLTGEPRVAVVDPRGRGIWTPVTLGAGAGGWHELRSPSLSPGTLVITTGQRGLPDSARVEPAP